MELVPEASKYGSFYAFDSADGERFILLEGLDVNQWHEPSGIEAFMLAHYDAFALFYSLLIFSVFSYLIIRHIITPLYRERSAKRQLRGLRS